MKSFKRMFTGRMFKAGSYSTFAAVVVIAIAVAVNAIVSSLPSGVTQIDLTSQSLYSLSDQTRRIVTSLDKDVTLSLLCTTGQEDSTINTLLSRYAGLSPRVTVKAVDPTTQPGFLKNYEVSDLYANSVLVECGDKYRFVNYTDIYVTSYSYSSTSYYGYDTTTSFNGEEALTSAIHYVTSDSLPKVYALNGHGESELDSSYTDDMEKENLETADLSLLTMDAVPEDASCVLIYAPTSDLSDTEAQKLIDFVNAGGGIVLITDYMESAKFPNLLTLTQAMGLTVQDGIVIEGDQNMCLRGYQHYLLPTINSHDITDPLIDGKYYALMPLAQGIVKTGSGTGTITALLSTSDSSYAKLAGLSIKSYDKEDGDIDGPFDVAVAVETGEGHFVWFASASMLSTQVNSMVSGANEDLFLNSLNWMCEQADSISIRSKSLETSTLTVPSAQSSALSILMIGVIPALLVAVGLVIWYRRKRR